MRLASDGGLYAIGVTGGSKGLQTINFAQIYENNVALVSKYQAIFAAGQQPATATNDNAAAGLVGETPFSQVLAGSAVALVSGTAKTITSLTLTAGDWEVSAWLGLVGNASTTYTQMIVGVSTVTDVVSFLPGNYQERDNAALVIGGLSPTLILGPGRISLSSTTIIYLVGRCTFSVSTMSAFGMIRARRPR
jgi:hypothetical protein